MTIKKTPTPRKTRLWPSLKRLLKKAKPELRHVAAGLGSAGVAAAWALIHGHGHLTSDDWEAIAAAFLAATGLTAWIPSSSQNVGD